MKSNNIHPLYPNRGFASTDPEPIEIFYPATIEGPPPPPRWIVDGLLLPGSVCLLTGIPGVGKSLLLQQMCTAIALEKPWLNKQTIQARCHALFAEDGREQLIRRQISLCEYYDVHPSCLELEFTWQDREAKDSTLWEVDARTGIGSPTPLWFQLWELVRDEEIRVLGLDTAAVTFAGNENYRSHVTPYMRALTAQAVINNCTIILNAHPSRANAGTYSGSSAWLASCRVAISLGRPKNYSEETGEPKFERVLRGLKSNYSLGIQGERLLYDHGAFIIDQDAAAATAKRGPLTHIEKTDLEYRLLQGLRNVRANGAHVPADEMLLASLPNRARRSPDPMVNHIALNDLYAAQAELITSGRVVRVSVGGKCMLRPAKEFYYPGEQPWLDLMTPRSTT
jgi:RecA-family ATPase